MERILQQGRDFTLTQEQANPEGEVVEKLQSLHDMLRAKRVTIRAVAFRSSRD